MSVLPLCLGNQTQIPSWCTEDLCEMQPASLQHSLARPTIGSEQHVGKTSVFTVLLLLFFVFNKRTIIYPTVRAINCNLIMCL